MRRAVLLLTAASLTGCNLAPKYARPETPVPPSWPVGDAYLRQSEASLPALTYRDVFVDPRLQRIIESALVNNRDLRIAAANIAAARAQYRIQRAEQLPAIDASFSYRYSDGGSGTRSIAGTGGTGNGTGTGGTGTGTGGTGTGTNPGTGTGTNPGTGTGTNTGSGTTGSVLTTGSGSSWTADLGITAFELDVFGRLRNLTAAAQNRYFEQEAAARATRLTLIGDIATAWLTYASDASLLKIARDTVASAERSVRLTRARLEGGIAPRTDLDQATLVQATAQSDLAEQTTLLAQDVNALQLLVGAPVDPTLLPGSIGEASQRLGEIPAGLDSGILLRRPDVVEAEYELRATNAEIGAARAALFPRISLTGIVGFASQALSSLFTGGAFNYSIAPNASYSIFQAGAARNNVRLTQAQRDAALANYERSIQIAFQEVSDALARRGTITDQLAAQQRLTAAATSNYRLSDARYRGGIDTFLVSLDAQRSLYSAQRTLVASQLTRGSNLVTLYRVLGGDALVEATPQGPRPTVAPTSPPAR